MPKTINAVKLYKLNDLQWVFDDPSKNIWQEAFVNGADTLIDIIIGKYSSNNNYVLLFSDKPFQDSVKIYLNRHQDKDPKTNGTHWTQKNLNRQLWLCPTLFDYYETTPQNLYFSVKSNA